MNDEPRGRGRPSRFRPEMIEKARTPAEFGATREEIGEFFGTDAQTLRNWAIKSPELDEALGAGAARADQRVKESLYRRAVGFEYEEEQAIGSRDGVEVVKVKRVMHGDVRAAALWLANRTDFQLNPSGRRKIDFGEMRGAEGISHAARQTLLALGRAEISPDEARMVIDALHRLGDHEERTILTAQVEALEADPKRLENKGEDEE